MVPVGDDCAMADAIVRAMDDPVDREARARHVEQFSIERITAQYLRYLGLAQ